MATYNQNEEDEQEGLGMNGSGAKPSESSQPVQLSNQTAPATPSAPKAPGPAKPASSGSAPGFQNYAKANQGSAQTKLNNAATANVTNQGNAATTAVNQATTSFGKKVDAGSLANRQKALEDVSNTLNSTRTLAAPPAPVASAAATMSTPGTSAATPDLTSGIAGVDRFKEVINAQYKGPESLRQSGLYNPAAAKVATAANTIKNTGTTAGREEMLKNMYSQRADYTTGLNKLDSALLNSSKQGVQQLQDAAKAQGNVSQSLDKAQIGSANLAQNRTAEISDIRNQARNAFTGRKTEEEAATEKRLDDMTKTPVMGADGKPVMKADGTPMTQWDQLPEMLKDSIRNKGVNNAAALKDATAAYNQSNSTVSDDQIKQAQADYIRASVGDPFGMGGPVGDPAALKQAYDNLVAQKSKYDTGLAQLNQKYNPNAINFTDDEAALLGINSGEGLYNLGVDAIKTGTAERDRLVSKDEQFRQAALAQLAGLDDSKQLNTNLKYTDADKAGTQSIFDSLDTKATREGLNSAEKAFQDAAMANTIYGQGAKKNKTNAKTYRSEKQANLGEALKAAGYNFDGANTADTGNQDVLARLAGVTDSSSMNDQKNMVEGAGSAWGSGFSGGDSNTAIGQAGNFIGSAMFGNVLTGALGLGGIGDALDNLTGSGANTSASKKKAEELAYKDLQKNTNAALDSAGFQNRVNIDSSSPAAQQKKAALEQLLASFDKTNVRG